MAISLSRSRRNILNAAAFSIGLVHTARNELAFCAFCNLFDFLNAADGVRHAFAVACSEGCFQLDLFVDVDFHRSFFRYDFSAKIEAKVSAKSSLFKVSASV